VDPVFAILDTILLVFGIAAGALALFLAIQSLRRLVLWDSAVGQVIGLARKDGYFFPRIHYTSRVGTVVEFISRQGRGVRGYAEGDSVVVLYDPASPSHAEIKSFSRLWFFPLVLAAFAALFIFGTLQDWPS
jgi:hypothetical protein